MILTGGKESRTLLVNLAGSRSACTLKTIQKWNEQHLIERSGKLQALLSG